MPIDIDNTFIYDIAFSFASEERPYVNEIYKILKDEYNLRVFYDEDREIKAKNWGGDLGEILQRVYEKESRYCVIFISKDYKEKVWTIHEKRSALARAIKQKGDYLLPARFDDTEIEGIPSTTSYIRISDMTPQDFSEFILVRLGIQIKQKETHLNESKPTDIRINTSHTAFIGYDPFSKQNINYHLLGINISNRGKDDVFLKYPKIALKNKNEHIPIFKDDFKGHFVNEIGKLESGNSLDIFTDPSKYLNLLSELDYVYVESKIGRVFKGNPDELNKAIDNWSKLK
jgi:hypothetical protein